MIVREKQAASAQLDGTPHDIGNSLILARAGSDAHNFIFDLPSALIGENGV
jgi:hypothetical protein